jgi:hypothetical protein
LEVTPSEERVARYTEIAREADELGRLIGVKRLKISQQIKILPRSETYNSESVFRQ